MDHDLIRALRARGVDVTTAHEAGMIARPDREHLEYATSLNRVLYSFNRRDFYRLHTEFLQQGKVHAGIILARQQHYSVGEQMRRLLKLNAARSPQDMENAIEFLSAWD